MKRSERLAIAISAFCTILNGRNHIFRSDEAYSVVGTSNGIQDQMDQLVELTNDNIYQDRLIDDAKQILK